MKASSALLKHIAVKSQQADASSDTKNLLAADPTSPDISSSDAVPIWLILTSKKFLTNEHRLKPRKVALPYSLNTSPNTSICLITAEPQRSFKDAIAHPSFPTSLSKCITKVISIEKLEKKYHSFESKRQLRDSYDLFLADDRIITYLAKTLGKTFYKTTPKRPIPIQLQAPKVKSKKNAALPSTKASKEPHDKRSILSPASMAKEIERTLSTAQIHISPSTTTAVKVGLASFTPEQVTANIEAVMAGLTEKLIAWRNVRALHLKGPNTMALPVWLANELWTDEAMVMGDHELQEIQSEKRGKGSKKRKGFRASSEAKNETSVAGNKRKDVEDIEKSQDGDEARRKKVRKLGDEDFSQEIKDRRQKLRQQKREARDKMEQDKAGDPFLHSALIEEGQNNDMVMKET